MISARKFIITILSLAILFAVCAFSAGCVSNPNESSAESSAMTIESELPKAPTEEDIANAQKTVLLTDKKVYDIDDELTLTIKAPNETDEIDSSYYCYVQYFNTETDEWTNCVLGDFIKDIGISTHGELSYSLTLSKRADAGHEKYRLKLDAKVNKVNLTLYSEEFTINND